MPDAPAPPPGGARITTRREGDELSGVLDAGMGGGGGNGVLRLANDPEMGGGAVVPISGILDSVGRLALTTPLPS